LEVSSARSATRTSRSALNGFSMIVVGAALDRGDSCLDVAMAGNHHHRHAGMNGLDLVKQRQSVELAALQPDIEKYEPRRPIGDRRKCGIAVMGGACFIALVLENARDNFTNVLFVIDDQNISFSRMVI
jgi:hypothetical protein